MKSIPSYVLLIVISSLSFVTCAGAVEEDLIEPGAEAPNFRLNDQYIIVRELEQFRGTPVVILYTGRDAFERAVEIEAEIQETFNGGGEDEDVESVIEVMVASNLKGLPFFLKKRVKNALKKPEYPSVLMDWKGEIANAYGYYEKGFCAFVIDESGIVGYSKLLEDENDFVILMEQINKIIKTGAETGQ